MKRSIRYIAFSLLLIFFSLSIWLLGTSQGNQTFLHWLAGDTLKIGTFEGSLWNDMQLQNLHIDLGDQQLSVSTLQLSWQPSALFKRRLHVRNLLADGIDYRSSAQESSESASPAELPLALQLDNVLLEKIRFTQNSTDTQINSLAFKAHSIDQTVKLVDINVHYQQHEVNAYADIHLQKALSFSTHIDWQGELPEVGMASGLADIKGDLNNIEAKLEIKTPAELKVQGSISLQQEIPVLSLRGEWNSLSWPLSGNADVISENGQLTLNGPLDKAVVSASSLVQLPQHKLPVIKTRLSGLLSSDRLDKLQIELHSSKGNVNADGMLSWSPELQWDISVNANGLDPSVMLETLPGQINLQANLKGGYKKQDLKLRTELKQLEGFLRGYPLRAKGVANYADKALSISLIEIFSGPNTFKLAGSISNQIDLDYEINAKKLSASWPELNGELVASGQFSGRLADPAITSRISAAGLKYQQHRVDKIDAELVWQKAMSDGQMLINNFSLGGLDGQQALLQISGLPEKHNIQLNLQADQLQLEATAQGNWQSPRWLGQFDQIMINQPVAGQWLNTNPVKLQVAADLITLEKSCFEQHKASFCAALQWQKTTTSIIAELNNLPLEKLVKPLSPDVEVGGLIAGEMNLQGPLDAMQGTAMLKLPTGQIMLETDEDALPLKLSDGVVEMSLAPKRNLAKLQLKAGQADISADISAGPFKTETAIPLAGQINASIPDLSQLSVFLPGLTNPEGRLQAQAKLNGTLQQPVIDGSLELQQARADIPQLGLQLTKASLTAKNQRNDLIVFAGQLTSGEGQLNLDGSVLLDQAKGWPTRITLDGENIQIARLPEAQITATPNLTVNLQKEKLDIKGKISIPKANIEVIELPRQAVAVSEDEVIIGEDPALANDTYKAIDANIDISLGKQVSFKGFGLNTRVEGDVNLYAMDGKNLAQGQLTLQEGKYKAYAQNLAIEKGRLLFNGPPQNPGLDIKATRLSQDKEVTAILNVSGNLQKPLVTISSLPALPEEEALSYLLTGRGLEDKGPDNITMLRMAAASKGLDKSQEILDRIASDTGLDDVDIQQGESLEDTSLLLGKYLSPDLYVSYAVGLFDNQGALLTRYRLSKRLRLEVQSGSTQSMDLIYSVEK